MCTARKTSPPTTAYRFEDDGPLHMDNSDVWEKETQGVCGACARTRVSACVCCVFGCERGSLCCIIPIPSFPRSWSPDPPDSLTHAPTYTHTPSRGTGPSRSSRPRPQRPRKWLPSTQRSPRCVRVRACAGMCVCERESVCVWVGGWVGACFGGVGVGGLFEREKDRDNPSARVFVLYCVDNIIINMGPKNIYKCVSVSLSLYQRPVTVYISTHAHPPSPLQ